MKHQLQTFFHRYGLRVDSAQLVAKLDCRVYRVCTFAGTGPVRDWALRVYPAGWQDATAILDEQTWLNGASRQGLHVPCPQADLQGRFLQAWPSQPGGLPQHAVLLSWLHGRMHDRALTPARLHRVGVLAGHLHRVSGQLGSAGVFKARRLAWTTDITRWISGTRARSDQLTAPAVTVLDLVVANFVALSPRLDLVPHPRTVHIAVASAPCSGKRAARHGERIPVAIERYQTEARRLPVQLWLVMPWDASTNSTSGTRVPVAVNSQ